MKHNSLNRRRITTLSGFLSAINIFVGIFLLIFIVLVQDFPNQTRTFFQFETNVEYVQINNDVQAIQLSPNQTFQKRSLNDYYFQIDYTIKQAICQPINVFHDKTAIKTIQTLTTQELNGILTPPIQIQVNILHLNGVLKSSERINLNQTEQSLCTYILELFLVMNFFSSCDNECQQTQVDILTSNKNLFGDLPNSSLKFSLPNVNLPDASIIFFIHNFAIYRTTKYFEKSVFIQSIVERRFVSTKDFYSNLNQSFISMRLKDKSLFVIKRGLDQLDSSSIYVSLLSLSIPNLYLRHQEGIIRLVKNDQSILFRQDATFKLISNARNDIIAFQTINLPMKYYIALSTDPEPTLILMPFNGEITIDKFDSRATFKLIVAS